MTAWYDYIGGLAERGSLVADGLADSTLISSAVSQNPAIHGGAPCIAGTRVPVFVVLDYLAEGRLIAEILGDFPHLSEKQVRGAIAWASQQITPHGED